MKNFIKYSIGILAAIVVIYFSLDIQKLDEYQATHTSVKFDATEFAGQFWDNQLSDCIHNAIDVNVLLPQIELNPERAFEKYAHKLGISKTYYIILKGSGRIELVGEEYILVRTDDNRTVQVATEFIFGNAIRDGSGMVDINQFINMTDFNNVSVALNRIAKEKVVSRIKKSAMVGMQIEFSGAAEINEDKVDLDNVSVIPIAVNFIDG